MNSKTIILHRRDIPFTKCKCKAYAFPHRPGAGKCDGGVLLHAVWQNNLCPVECIHYTKQGECSTDDCTLCPLIETNTKR